jgi:hypothetical protein
VNQLTTVIRNYTSATQTSRTRVSFMNTNQQDILKNISAPLVCRMSDSYSIHIRSLISLSLNVHHLNVSEG